MVECLARDQRVAALRYVLEQDTFIQGLLSIGSTRVCLHANYLNKILFKPNPLHDNTLFFQTDLRVSNVQIINCVLSVLSGGSV